MAKLKYNYHSSKLTDFTIRVLRATEKIPVGQVITYESLAKAIGMPKAARAVGNALNKNPFVPYVPCHRVIKSDGSLGGYGSGTKKKIEILRKEGVEFAKNLKIKNFRKILEKL